MDMVPDWTWDRPTDADLAALTALVRASDIAAVGYPDSSAEDVAEALTTPATSPAQDHWIVRDGAGRIVGWGYLDRPQGARQTVEVFVDPARGAPAIAPLLDRLLARAADRGADRVRAWAIPGERAYLEVLTAAGFTEVKRYARMRGPLHPLPRVDAPGVVVRPLRPDYEADLAAFHRVIDTAFRDSGEYEPEDYAHWRARVAAMVGVSWDEWLVAEVDGAVVGILQSAPPSDPGEGWVRNLAVLAEARGRGVAKALLARAFAIYAAKGRTSAGLGVDLTNPTRAYRLYAAVGMIPAYEALALERALP